MTARTDAQGPVGTYVRRVTKNGTTLTYHKSRCRHVQGKPGVEPVTGAEFDRFAAAYNDPDHPRVVEFRGRRTMLWACGLCIDRDYRMPSWS